MKLVTFEVGTQLGQFRRIGAMVQEAIVDLTSAHTLMLAEKMSPESAARIADAFMPPSMLNLLEAGDFGFELAGHTIEYVNSLGADASLRGPRGETIIFKQSEVTLLAPVPRPRTMRDFLTFQAHAENSAKRSGREVPALWFEMPTYYKGNPDTVIGPEEDILWPGYTQLLDYELEFGLFIKKQGTNIRVEDAHEYIGGYTIFNDISARDIQRKEMSLMLGPTKGKDMNHGNVLGPCLVTPDEFDPAGATMIARVNGAVWSEGNTGDMYYPFPKLIEYVSQDETLHPGDFFGSGTVGYGCGIEHGNFIKPGDVIELEVEGIGILRNRVVKKETGE
ncbi:MAG: fumarylacetoacetate hydrolase family protein [Candidatus Hydrogenedentota bacterium]|nr:MAG: fumarylacetoacetate hydrolase family protein [Candidatus Hydrogenedentota bacterium]